MTGATGFLGTELAAKFCRMQDVKVFALVLAESAEEAYHRLRDSWHHDRALYESIGDVIIPVCGDFTKTGLRAETRSLHWAEF